MPCSQLKRNALVLSKRRGLGTRIVEQIVPSAKRFEMKGPGVVKDFIKDILVLFETGERACLKIQLAKGVPLASKVMNLDVWEMDGHADNDLAFKVKVRDETSQGPWCNLF